MAGVSGYASTETSIQWEIYGLLYPANGYENFRLELWRDGSYLSTTNWTTSSTSDYTRQTFYGLSSGTQYSAKAWARYAGGSNNYLGEAYYSTDAPAPVRPSEWSWFTTKTSGQDVNLTASEWNSFCDRINEFRDYKGQGSYTFTSAYTGAEITASIVNQARSAIGQAGAAVPSLAVSGGTMTASFFNGLKDSLNSIA